jgi:predicted nucleic acid-binding protein
VKVLFDTSVVIDILRGAAPAIAYARTLPEPPTCSEITRVEVIRGLRSGERRATERLFAALRWVAVDEMIARRAGELGRRFCRSHPGLATADLIIAATVEELGLELATLNVRHFPMISGLTAPYPLSEGPRL